MLQKRKLEFATNENESETTAIITHSIKNSPKWVEINKITNDDINDLLEANQDSVDFPRSTIHSSKMKNK